MNKKNIHLAILNDIFSFVSEYYGDTTIAEYLFDIFSIRRQAESQQEATFEKFVKILNHIQMMSGDQHICFNCGRYFAKNQLRYGSLINGIRFSVKKCFNSIDKILKELFPYMSIHIVLQKKTGVTLSISNEDPLLRIDYFFSEYVKGILSYIPVFWGLPSAKVKIKSYPFILDDLLNHMDFIYQKKCGLYHSFDKTIAEEKILKTGEENRNENRPIQVIKENIYIKYAYVEKDISFGTSSLEIEIAWINKKRIPLVLLFLSASAGAALSVYSAFANLFDYALLSALTFLYEILIILLFTIYRKKELKRLYISIESDLVQELSLQKSITAQAIEGSRTRIESIENLMEITKRLIQDEDIVNLFDNIRKLAAKALNADRTTVFIHDRDTRELRSGPELSEEKQEFRIPEDRGIAGEIFKLRKIVNIKDAYNNPNFNKSVDRQTGYRTKTILGAPLIDLDDNLVGIIQVLNKIDGEFQSLDEQILESLSTYIAIALKNTMTIHKLQIQGIDPEMARGLSSIIMSMYYGYQTIENELNMLDIPSINSLKPMIKDLTELMENLIFLFDEDNRVNNSKIPLELIHDTFRTFIRTNKKEKNIRFIFNSCIREREMIMDMSIINKAFTALLKNCIEAIGMEGEISVNIYYYSEIPNSLIHEYALGNVLDSFNRYSDENSAGLISYIKNRKPLLEKDLSVIEKSMKEFIAFNFFDTGDPVISETKDKIFHPFFSTKNHFGLGLAIAKKAMHITGGRIEVPRQEKNGKSIRVLITRTKETQ